MNMTNNESGSKYKKLKIDSIERVKELAGINKTTGILREGKPIDETLQYICDILPSSWQYPESTVIKIVYGNMHFETCNFKKTIWSQNQKFKTIDAKKGYIEVCYLNEFPDENEGPFLKEERDLIENITLLITGYLNEKLAKEVISDNDDIDKDKKSKLKDEKITSRQLLQSFLNINNVNRDIYHDLMSFKVKEILLIANLYDAYSIEKEGRFSEHVLGEYHQLNLTSLPRITGASSEEEVFSQLNSKHFDMIIIMSGADRNLPLSISKKIKKQFTYIPILLLLNNNSEIDFYEKKTKSYQYIDRTFVWNGDSSIFFSMIKLVEDRINIENDTEIGLVRVILLVEDSPQYYSRYLPLLYKIILEQTKRIIDDVSTDELYKVLRLRARPKIILASTYEGAVEIINKYKDYLLCLITDVKYEKEGKLDENAGFELVKYAREKAKEIPTIIQSSDVENAIKVHQLRSIFINKNSETLLQDFQSFITHYLGFGNFVYRNKEGRKIGVAKSLKEFEKQLKIIPDESLLYHAKKNHFSLWLMARGEIQAAKVLNPRRVNEFKSSNEIRKILIDIIQRYRNEKKKGKIISFDQSDITDESNIVSLFDGSLGGKGRGLAFVNNLIYNYDFLQYLPDINIRAPKTLVIGTDEFEYFIERNNLLETIIDETDYEVIKKVFLKCNLTKTLERRLKIVLTMIKEPVAIRSSGLFEDSLVQPFAGIFETYLLPNNHPEIKVRLQQVMDAIKLVFASVFSKIARGYVKAINYKIEEEKMAVIIQEVVGNEYDGVFYPHISGVAQSYNYYPFSHMKPEEGFAVAAVGLGKYVVEGENAYRFSPKYPSTEINSPKDQFKNSQTKFFAVNLKKKDIDLLEGDTAGLTLIDIDEAERHGNLRHLASVYNIENNVIYPGINKPGPRIINFANILKYNYIPLAKTIEVVLDLVKEAIGSPVEIEFAVDLNKDDQNRASFYLLQIKPLIGNASDYDINMSKIKKESIVLYTKKGMGNGLIKNITDVIYIDREVFDKSKTVEMVDEIEMLNEKMAEKNKNYILIGPGRWGTRDRWIGIPVNWPQISNAKVIVETSFEDYPLDSSSGSHFFHNVTSMNVGYFSVNQEKSDNYIKWDILEKQKLIERTKYFKHVRFEKPVKVRMDGKKRISLITWEKKGKQKK